MSSWENSHFWYEWHQIKEDATLQPKINMFCALYQNFQHLLKTNNLYVSYSKLSKELKDSIRIEVGQAVHELLIKAKFELF